MRHLLAWLPGLIATLWLAPPLAAPAAAQTSWAAAAAAVERQRAAYYQRAIALGAEHYLGTMHNEWDIPEHTCAILGRMLGRADLIGHLEPAYPPLSSNDGMDIRLAAHSMENWLGVLRILLDRSQTEREADWDLQCAGQLDIPATARIAPGAREAFVVYDSQSNMLRVLGEVTEGYAARLRAALDAHPRTEIVSLGSGGGSVVEAMEAGREIRRRGLETMLYAACDSACPLVFMGGTSRTVWSPLPPLRFHMLSVQGRAIPAPHPFYDEIAAYVTEMGGDGAAYVAHMLAAPPDQLHAPSYPELCEQNIVDWAQRGC